MTWTGSIPCRDIWQEMSDWLQKTHQKRHLTPHDVTTGTQIAMIVTGGDIDAGIALTENEICALERKAFVTLAGTKETKARIEHMLGHRGP